MNKIIFTILLISTYNIFVFGQKCQMDGKQSEVTETQAEPLWNNIDSILTD